MRTILNRMNYRLRPVLKSQPQKKIPETDAIFDNVREARARGKADSSTLRISIDSKAKVKVGPFSRRGKSRCQTSVTAADHDMQPEAIMTPFGILEEETDQLYLVFGTSRETSDFIVDALPEWWAARKSAHHGITRLQIFLDNGPAVSSRRTQFVHRMLQFADLHGLEIELIYYPPYHSKYNPIERCWGVLEAHWNGTLLSSIDAVLRWAASMTWRNVSPIVQHLSQDYVKGERPTPLEIRDNESRLSRSETLPKWHVAITPSMGYG